MSPSRLVVGIVLACVAVILGLVWLDLATRKVEVLVRNASEQPVVEVDLSLDGGTLIEVARLEPGEARRSSYVPQGDGAPNLHYRSDSGEMVRVEGPYTTGGSHGRVEFTFLPSGEVEVVDQTRFGF